MAGSRLAILIPAFNEACNIAQTISAILSYGVPLVIDDGSSDGTADLAEAAGAKVLRLAHNQGYDQALNQGFQWCDQLGFQFLITFDADGQHPADAISLFEQQLEKGIEVVVGQRQGVARWSEKLFSCFTKWRYGINDPLCGMKGYQMSVYHRFKIFDSYGSVGTELMMRALNAGCSSGQVAIRVRERQGVSRFGGAFKANFKIVRALLVASFMLRPS